MSKLALLIFLGAMGLNVAVDIACPGDTPQFHTVGWEATR